MLFLVKPV